MPESVQEVMTPDPITIQTDATVREAAALMRDDDIGDVVICDGERAVGILTDRDIVVRCLAEGGGPDDTVGDFCSRQLVSVSPDDTAEHVIELMREKAVRRVLVLDMDTPVGVVSLGDLAIERDRHSALGDISAAPPTH